MKRILLFSTFLISVLTTEAQLVQVVTEVFDPSLLPGAEEYADFAEENNLTTYRIYAELELPTNRVGTIIALPLGCLCTESPQHQMPCAPVYFSTTTSFFNEPDFGSANGEMISPILFPFVPELAGDSWLTIGKENDDDLGQLVTFPNLENASAFTEEEGENLYSISGPFIVNPGGEDAIYPVGPDNRTLLGQITTDGELWFGLSIVIFPTPAMGVLYTHTDCVPINAVYEVINAPNIGLTYPPNQGCMDEDACNYDPNAMYDDYTCLYIGDYCNDNDPFTYDTILDENCDCTGGILVTVLGCTDELACNYDPVANSDNGLCFFVGDSCDDDNPATINTTINEACECSGGELVIIGCTDNIACNFNPEANVSSNMCEFPGDPCDDGDPETINDALTEACDCVGEEVVEVTGCTDNAACNYNADANTDDGSCDFPGDPCDDGDPETFDDVLTEACDCEGVVSVDERFMASIQVFPNPANDVLTIDLGSLNDLTQLTIYDLNGRMVVSEQVIGRTTINVDHLAVGVYVLLFETLDARGQLNVMITR